ncbi:hypothetical protein L2E82_49979 [Cichorium intybus]|nr:hypothetical protein L2E82_49979 [Cichorium intybus]
MTTTSLLALGVVAKRRPPPPPFDGHSIHGSCFIFDFVCLRVGKLKFPCVRGTLESTLNTFYLLVNCTNLHPFAAGILT